MHYKVNEKKNYYYEKGFYSLQSDMYVTNKGPRSLSKH